MNLTDEEKRILIVAIDSIQIRLRADFRSGSYVGDLLEKRIAEYEMIRKKINAAK